MTREEAIKVLEEMSLWKYCEPEAEAAKFAIAALREQEERSKGCKFCKGAKYIYGELSASGHIDDDHDFVHEQYGDFPICPMCGRRLEEV